MVGNQLLVLRKITLGYVLSEDRVRMQAETRQAEVVVLWFSQRACKELVKALASYLEDDIKTKSLSTPSAKVAVQAHYQQSALADRPKVTPVKTVGKKPISCLVQKMSIHYEQGKITLTIALQGDQSCGMTMTTAEARQWLQAIFSLYKRAQWPTDNWPQWVSDAVLAESSGGTLH